MGVARSSFYAEAEGKPRDEEAVAEICAITDEFESDGYRRVDAELGVSIGPWLKSANSTITNALDGHPGYGAIMR